MEYDRYNNLLKTELPHLLDLRSQLLKPGIQTLLAFQKLFYAKSTAIFSSATLAALAPESTLKSTNEKFEKEIEPVMREIRTMGMFHGSGLKRKHTIFTIVYIFILSFSSLIIPFIVNNFFIIIDGSNKQLAKSARIFVASPKQNNNQWR